MIENEESYFELEGYNQTWRWSIFNPVIFPCSPDHILKFIANDEIVEENVAKRFTEGKSFAEGYLIIEKIKNRLFVPTIDLNEEDQITGLRIGEGFFVEEINSNEAFVNMVLPDKSHQTILLKKTHICFDREKAEKKLFDLHTNFRLKEIKNQFPNELLPDKINNSFNGGWMSGNPLRFGEPKVGYFAQSNTFGKLENPQKIVQMLAAVNEDIEILFMILDLLYQANDYTKKLLGKYVIIEMNSIFILLKKLSGFNKRYKDQYYTSFVQAIGRLEDKFNFKIVRDKIAAHRDINVDLLLAVNSWKKITRFGLIKYLEEIQNHLNEFLTELYPFEKRSYFLASQTSAPTPFYIPQEREYERFDGNFD